MSPPETFCFALVVARQVRTDGLPVHAAVGRFKQTLARVVKRVGIVRREHDGRGPLEAVFQVGRAVSVGEFGLLGDRLHLADVPVVARDVALIVGGINDVRVARIGRNVACLAAAHVVPIAAVNRAVVAAAGDRDGAAVLLRPVDAVGRRRVGDDVVELRGRLVVLHASSSCRHRASPSRRRRWRRSCGAYSCGSIQSP